MADGKRPLSVGFWFSLGHSTIVFALALGLSVGIRSLAGPVRHGDSRLHQVTGWVGTLVSGGFHPMRLPVAAVDLDPDLILDAVRRLAFGRLSWDISGTRSPRRPRFEDAKSVSVQSSGPWAGFPALCSESCGYGPRGGGGDL
jgi:hypothetical protein